MKNKIEIYVFNKGYSVGYTQRKRESLSEKSIKKCKIKIIGDNLIELEDIPFTNPQGASYVSFLAYKNDKRVFWEKDGNNIKLLEKEDNREDWFF